MQVGYRFMQKDDTKLLRSRHESTSHNSTQALMTPLVSVYITNHNYGRFIKESIESVLCQTMSDFELIIIDDGSTDNSKELIEEYAEHEKIQIIYQNQRGLNVTNNIALRVAHGKYIMRLDADDFLDRNALLVLSSEMEKDETLGLVFPDYYIVDTNGHVLHMERRHNFESDVTLPDQPAHGACTMIRREFLKDVGGYNEGFSCQDGYDLWMNFIFKHGFKNVNLPLFYYRQHGSNLTTNEQRIYLTRTDIKKYHFENNYQPLSASVVIPVRGGHADPGRLALQTLGRVSVLEWTLSAAFGADLVSDIIITSSDDAVFSLCKDKGLDRYAQLIPRPEALERQNVGIGPTLDHLFMHKQKPQVVVVLSIANPFLNRKYISDAVRSFSLYEVDTIIGARSETSALYTHDGSGLQSILEQERFTRLERDALFRYTGGLTAFRGNESKDFSARQWSRRGHVLIDQLSAHTLASQLDLRVAEFLIRDQGLHCQIGDASSCGVS